MFGCICFSLSALLPTRRHPHKKRLGNKGAAGLRVGEGQRAKSGVPSPLNLLYSWKTVWGVKTQSTKVWTAPFLECLGFCYSKCSSQKSSTAFSRATAGCEHSWPDVAKPGADTAVQMLQSWVPAGRLQWGGYSRVPVTGGKAACSTAVLLLPGHPQHMRGGFGSRTSPKPCAA